VGLGLATGNPIYCLQEVVIILFFVEVHSDLRAKSEEWHEPEGVIGDVDEIHYHCFFKPNMVMRKLRIERKSGKRNS
jgi:hypothetical protein